ncbi:MAG: hypothetical protein C0402_11060 [Thermodesulfovibrio sp.]|nr:hypothetical protein [Thermodesulfovibrio sp.]
MKFPAWIARLHVLTRWSWFAALVLGNIAAGDCFAANASFEYIDVSVRKISYQGNNNYRVDLTIYNRSNNTIVLKENNETFYVQTDILGKWQELSASHHGGGEGTVLLPREGRNVEYMVNIPLNIPALYVTSEGDINMMIRYLVRFLLRTETGLRSNSGESLYWITPNTDTWVLREGM